jgi:hypothetical protein
METSMKEGSQTPKLYDPPGGKKKKKKRCVEIFWIH